VNVRSVHELLLFIVLVALAAIMIGPNVVLVVPPIVLTNPESVTAFAPAESVPPLFVQFPATVTAPDNVCVPALNVTFPNVIAVVGVIVAIAVKIAVLVALNVIPPVAETVRSFAKFIVAAANVVNTGVAAPPDANAYVLLKFIVPAPVNTSEP